MNCLDNVLSDRIGGKLLGVSIVCGRPSGCKRFFIGFGHVVRCCRVSGLMMRPFHAAGPYGIRGADLGKGREQSDKTRRRGAASVDARDDRNPVNSMPELGSDNGMAEFVQGGNAKEAHTPDHEEGYA